MVMFTFFCFHSEIPFLGKFGPNNQNCQFRQKFVTKANSNMQNSMVMFPFSFFEQKYFFGQIWSKKLNCQFKLKFGTKVFPSVGGLIPQLPKKLPCPPNVLPPFCPKSVDFVIFMQSLAISPKLLPPLPPQIDP